MRTIDRIYISCCKRDVHLARICVASIRYWYPDILISIVKDYTLGFFDTAELEQYWNVSVLNLPRKKFGWSFIKLEPFFLESNDRFFGIDADIIFIGPVLDRLNTMGEDFIVHGSQRTEPDIRSHYYKVKEIQKQIDPQFRYPGYIFNCGHIVGTGGILKREDFEPLVSWDSTFPELKFPEIFSHADQGIMNYVIHRKELNKEIRVGSIPFSIWADSTDLLNIDIQKVKDRQADYPKLIHYAGTKPLMISKMPRSDLLRFYELFYYSKIPGGPWKRRAQNQKRITYFFILDLAKKAAPRSLVDAIKRRV